MENIIAAGNFFIGAVDEATDKYSSATSKPPITDAKIDANQMNQRTGMTHQRIWKEVPVQICTFNSNSHFDLKVLIRIKSFKSSKKMFSRNKTI